MVGGVSRVELSYALIPHPRAWLVPKPQEPRVGSDWMGLKDSRGRNR